MAKFYSRNREIIDGSIDDSQVMMHIEKGMYYGLNSVGKRIWELTEERVSEDEIVASLLSEYEVSEEICRKEVAAFLQKAVESDILNREEV